MTTEAASPLRGSRLEEAGRAMGNPLRLDNFSESITFRCRQASVPMILARRVNMMKYSLARFSVSPNHIKSARLALQRLVAATQKQDPGLVYLVFQEEEQSVFFTLVSFQDEAAYRRYARSRHVAAFARTMLPLCEGKPSFVGLDLVSATRRLANASPAVLPAQSAGSRAGRGLSPVRRRRRVP
jgi:quinol monooxygenase YgiN